MFINGLKTTADVSQRSARQYLADRQREGHVSQVTPFWIINGLAVTATREIIEALALRSDVQTIYPNRILDAPQPISVLSAPQQNLAMINTPLVWARGIRGKGIVVANMDTGVAGNHPDLAKQWRGGKNSWYDPYGEHPDFPTDNNGHGTWTMGVMVADSPTGEQSNGSRGAVDRRKDILMIEARRHQYPSTRDSSGCSIPMEIRKPMTPPRGKQFLDLPVPWLLYGFPG